mmetsp:Transcript_37112/g.50231  ORF Transcript_37112/g.50231 Transcript_37112/m.50231 type:complete len:108 (-) Transcript_37112:1311-1634(-)
MASKGFAVGFRVEHPQSVINDIQYHHFINSDDNDPGNENNGGGGDPTTDDRDRRGLGPVPVADYRLVNTEHTRRSVYSFCMCPGGQIVPTTIDPEELCVNGMSFSRR